MIHQTLPSTIVLEITYRCNIRCVMCWWWGDSGIVETREDLHDELSLQEWQQFIESVSFFSPQIRITGGEPFVRPDMLDLVEYIRSKSLECSFISNGTRLDSKRINGLIELGVRQITFSVHGDARADALIRGAGAFEKTMATIRELLAAKKQHGTEQPEVIINCVVSPHNLDSLPALIHLGQALGVHVRIQHPIWYDQPTIDTHMAQLQTRFGLTDPTLQGFVQTSSHLDPDTLCTTLEAVNYLNHEKRTWPSYTLPNLNRDTVRKWYTDLQYCGAANCHYVFHAGRVKANGDVVVCPYVNYVLGNVKTESFVDLFQSEAAVQFRQVVGEQLLPGCVRCCKLRWD